MHGHFPPNPIFNPKIILDGQKTHFEPKSPLCMIKIFFGGRGGDTFKTPSPYEQLLPLPTPYFKMFLERSLNDPPPPHFKHLSLLPPTPSTTPSPLKILIIHLSTAIFPKNPILTPKSLCTAIPQNSIFNPKNPLIQSDLCDLADLCFVPAVLKKIEFHSSYSSHSFYSFHSSHSFYSSYPPIPSIPPFPSIPPIPPISPSFLRVELALRTVLLNVCDPINSNF